MSKHPEGFAADALRERKKRLGAEWTRLFTIREALENQRENISSLCDHMDTRILSLQQTVQKKDRPTNLTVWESQLEDAKKTLHVEEKRYQEIGVRLLGVEREAARVHEEMDGLPA